MLLPSNYEVPLSTLTTWNSEIAPQWTVYWALAAPWREEKVHSQKILGSWGGQRGPQRNSPQRSGGAFPFSPFVKSTHLSVPHLSYLPNERKNTSLFPLLVNRLAKKKKKKSSYKSLGLFYFLFWLPHGIWRSGARDQVWATVVT